MKLTDLIPWPYRWLALSVVCAGLWGYGWVKGAEHGEATVQARWDKEKSAQTIAAQKADAQNRQIEQALQQKVTDAQNAAQTREKSLQAAAAGARAQSDSLRDQLTAIRGQLPALADAAVRDLAGTATELLSECSERYTDVAAKADAIWSDRKTLEDAWPEK